MEEIKVQKKFTKLLPCKLTHDELLQYGNDLGSVIQDMQTEEDKQTSLKTELKARLATLESQKTELATKITRKEELRDIEVESRLNFASGTYQEIRLDTDEIVSERPLLPEEQQENIDL
jgi:hypothetical protein